MHLLWLSYDLELLSERHDECIISYGFHTSWNSPCYRALGATISAFSRTFAKGRWIIKNEQVKNANAHGSTYPPGVGVPEDASFIHVYAYVYVYI